MLFIYTHTHTPYMAFSLSKKINQYMMLALSLLFSTIGLSVDQDHLNHEYSSYFCSDQTADSFVHVLPSHQPQVELDRSTPSTPLRGEDSSVSPMAKKLHNASERDRRKTINNLYSSLRSLLPADQAVCTK